MNASDYKQPASVLIPISFAHGTVLNEINTAHCLNAIYLTKEGIMSHQQTNKVVVPCLTPDRAEKRQNGRRFKDNGEPSFTLTAQDIHGVAISVSGNEVAESEQIAHCLNANDQRKVFGAKQDRTMVELQMVELQSEDKKGIYVELSPTCHVYAVWYEKYQCYVAIRKLTPKECFRLQGWDDEYFERAQFVNSDTQLYKQAGNGVTVNVVYEIGRLINSSEE